MITAYCKKCKDNVAPGEVCPRCGGKLTKASLRVHWELLHDPVKDWMCWNSAARIVLPVTAAMVALLLVLEAISGGGAAVQKLLESGLMTIVGTLVAVFFLGMWLLLLLQGEEIFSCTLDSRGAHVTIYLENPTKTQQLARFRRPTEEERVIVAQRDFAWRDVNRIQLWPEKLLILFYAPRWWMRLSVPCLPESWPSAILFMQEKVGKKKTVQMPEVIRHATEYFPPEEAAPPEATVDAEETPFFQPEETLFVPEEADFLPVEEDVPFAAEEENLPSPAEDAPLPEDQVAGGEQGSFLA